MIETLPATVSNFDVIEAELATLPQVDMPLTHIFTPGIYVRQIEIPAGTLLTSMEHLTEHPFFILKGRIEVRSEFECIEYCAPCMGITKPGTRRMLYAVEDTIWATVHANPDNLKTPEEIGAVILNHEANALIGDPSAFMWRNSSEKLTERTN